MREEEREREGEINPLLGVTWVSLTDAVVDVFQSSSELQTGWLVSLTEDTGLHEGGEVPGSVGGHGGSRVIATHSYQSRIDDIISDQVLTEENEPELIVCLSLSWTHWIVCSV